MSEFWVVKNWERFQHYSGRRPPWIKLHRGLLDDAAFHSLPVASKALAPMLWLLASEFNGGRIELNPAEIAWRLRVSESDLMEAAKPLVERGFLNGASSALAACKQDAIAEIEKYKYSEKYKRSEKEGSAQSAAPHPAGTPGDTNAGKRDAEESAPGSAAGKEAFAFAGSHLLVTQRQDGMLGEAFPWVNRPGEYRKADSWLEANPGRRPKKPAKFLHNWFAKEPKPTAGIRGMEF